jgi:hypothetical protein
LQHTQIETMKLIKTAILAMALASCAKEKDVVEEPKFNHPDWMRLEIEQGKEMHAVYGNLDDTLMVSTLTEIFQTTDKGKTWLKAKVNHHPVYGFLSVKDTVFSFESIVQKDKNSPKLATFSQSYSIDKGFNWLSRYDVPLRISKPFATIALDNGVEIKVKENLEPINGNINHNLVLKSQVEVVKNGFSKTLILPFDNQITNIYVDKKGRLYVSATSSIFDKSGRYLDYEKKQPAILYISKNNIQSLID